ncbi:macro domain-containing protein [Chryseobacterium sp. ES2]|uniref:Macro domain-containing protein n=1 Tax=Chryseobacterium metallicongregator TaxID=3073042 RepID=A0ABU1EBD9_9FLAO|nr:MULTISPECIES: macro domain-containing protein [Chryseobacterium]MDR4955134.1 macro domain-containing protein [Chryseobacterium sp. ES2]
MKTIQYIKGDAIRPNVEGNKIISHICNDIGGWGKGFVTTISKRWKQPEQAYREWFKSKENFILGEIQMVQTEKDIWICNMIAQHNIITHSDIPPIRYNALEECLLKLSYEAQEQCASVHMPRIGCGLAGGKWEEIEPIIGRTLLAKDVEVYVYDFE